MPTAHTLTLGTPVPQPKVTFQPYSVLAYETRTGRVAGSIPFVGVPRWSAGLSTPGAWSVTVALGGSGISPDLLDGLAEPQVFSWAICQGSRIWQAGPVVGESYSDGQSNTTVSGTGLWGFLTNKRLLVNPARATLAGVGAADADVAFAPTSATNVSEIGTPIPAGNRDLSLHTIAKRIVQTIEGAAGGDLPIVYPDDIAGAAQRTYPGYDLASPGQRLTDLTGVIGGPEIEFRPSFVDDTTRQFIQHTMRIGNDQDPVALGHLGNLSFAQAWDYGKALVKLDISRDGSNKSTRDFERGNGLNRDIVVGFYDSPISASPGSLLLETVGSSHTSSDNKTELNGYAQSAVVTNAMSTPTFTAEVRIQGDDQQGRLTRSPNLASMENGDNFVSHVTGHRRLTDGTYYFRIINMSQGSTTQQASLALHFLGRT